MVREISHWKLENFLQQKNKKMATTFKWTISVLNSRIKETIEGQELHDVVNVVHWRYKGTRTVDDIPYEKETYGSLGVETDPNDFILYENLTKDDVIGWLEEGLDVTEMQENLNKGIDLLINPVEETLPLPWDNE